MKRLTAMMLVGCMAASLFAGCGGGNSDSSSSSGGSDASSDVSSTETGDAPEGEAVAEGTETAGGGSGSSAPDWKPYDELIAKIKASTDLTEREAMMHQAEDMLMETYAVVPLYYYNDPWMLKTGLDGMRTNLFGYKYFMYMTGVDGTLALNLASEPAKLDPALNSSVDGACLACNSFVGLYAYGAEGTPEPALAEGYELSEDGLTYTIHLKSDLKWSDGSPLNANDFVYSWKRAANPDTAADYSYLFDVFAKEGDEIVVSAPDENTLTCTLIAPCAYFEDLLSFPVFMPVNQAAVEAADPDGTNPGAWAAEAGFISNGAYTLKEWKHDESMVYVKNPNFYDADNVTVDELHFMLSADDAAIYGAYQDNSLQFIDTIANDELTKLLEAKDPELHVSPQLGTYYCGFNVNSSLFDGLTEEQANNMRKALNLLIDRQYIVDTIGQTGQEIANTFIPSGMADGNGGEFRANDDAYTFPDEANKGYFDASAPNVDEAISLLETCGYQFDDAGMLSPETPLVLTYLTNDAEGNVKIAEAIQQDFAAIGIEMSIEQQEWNVFLETRKAGQFDFCREGWIADYNDPINMLEMWTTDSGNNDCQFGR